MTRTYDVFLSDTLVGHILQGDDGRISFRFADEYERLPYRPVLGQFFEDDLRKTYTGKRGALPPFFANLVPEGHLRKLIERSLQLPEDDDLALLSAVGRDLPGAVEIRPGSNEPDPIEGEQRDDDHEGENLSIENGSAFRFSLAGVQMKFSVLKESDKVTLPAHNRLGEWIVKLDSNRFPHLVENEFATLAWAKAAGFIVPECEILQQDSLPPPIRALAPRDSNVFLIQRYDRVGAKRIHQEDFAQVFGQPPERKYVRRTYEQCAFIVLRIAGRAAYFEFVRRLVFI